jgi:S1-C subfamily serine protease
VAHLDVGLRNARVITHVKPILKLFLAIPLVVFASEQAKTPMHSAAKTTDTIPLSAPVTTELAGKTASIAQTSVFRIVDVGAGSGGTGFLHKSGKIITAAHVVANPRIDQIKIVLSSGAVIDVKSLQVDADLDLAVLEPAVVLPGKALPIHSTTTAPAGLQVLTWGFPEGYGSLTPLLTVGYVAGTDEVSVPSGKRISRFVINAAFNRGNSGGPVIRMEDGAVVGVVSSKLAPIPPYIVSALQALANQQSGFTYEATDASGKKIVLTEGKIIGDVLFYLRSQTQLVIGHAVSTAQLVDYLRAQNIEP